MAAHYVGDGGLTTGHGNASLFLYDGVLDTFLSLYSQTTATVFEGSINGHISAYADTTLNLNGGAQQGGSVNVYTPALVRKPGYSGNSGCQETPLMWPPPSA